MTAANNFGEPVIRQTIHDATLELVRNAQDFLVLDYFLFNGAGLPVGPLRYGKGIQPVARELRGAILALHAARPSLPILVIVDPINDYYRGTVPAELLPLRQAGVDVVVVDLDPLRDSNPLYSTTWRLLAGWWLKSRGDGGFANPLDATGPRLRFGALARIPQFKADHRKIALTGDGRGSLIGIVSSANPHDASSAHSNVALRLAGEPLRPLLDSELAIARLSGWGNQQRFDAFVTPPATAAPPAAAQDAPPAVGRAPDAGSTRAAIVTEGAIRDALVAALATATRGDAIDIAQFYLSDRPVIEGLLAASRSGADIRVLLDPNKDAFGYEKSGIPNREVASELMAASDGAIRVRWYRTHGEQFHGKLVALRHQGRLWLMLGSANFTRRNIGDYNLEADVVVDMPADSAVATTIAGWFEMIWSNHPGSTEYSSDAELYADPSLGRYWYYRLLEAGGLSAF